ncbi:MAG: UDP-glucose 4-epimerase [Actinomycetota bacterium]|nr:UDP-glucose 4-epimerase [Actinomycetota bacterium]
MLVTGAAGAIGSNLTAGLLAAGARVTAWDDLSSGAIENLPADPALTFLEGSVLEEELLDRAFGQGPEVVFHLAALFAHQNSVEHPQRDLQVNGSGTLGILQRSCEAGVRRVVYSSSSCVLQPPTAQAADGGAGADPLSPARPAPAPARPAPDERVEQAPGSDTPYQITKYLGEQYCRFFHRCHGLSTVRVRIFNSYGPGEPPGLYRNVIPNFFHLARLGRPLPVLGTGSETRDWTYVEDIVEGLLAAGLAQAADGQVICLGTGKETRVVDLARRINAITGNRAGLAFRPRRSWDNHGRRVAPTERARRLLGHECRTPLDIGLQRTAAWFEQRWGSVRAGG